MKTHLLIGNDIEMFGGCLPPPSLPGQGQWEVSLPGPSLARHNNNNMTNMTSDAPVSSGLALIGPQTVVKAHDWSLLSFMKLLLHNLQYQIN